MEKVDTYILGERVKKSITPTGFQVIYSSESMKTPERNEILLGKKSVIFLPGDASAETPAEINAHCKVVENILKSAGMIPEEMPHFYGLGYSFKDSTEHRESVIHEMQEKKFWGDEKKQNTIADLKNYWEPFFSAFLMPLIADKSGKKKTFSEIRKNLQNITFVTHCHGGMVSFRLEQMMAEKLDEFYPGYSKELMANLRMVHFSSRRPLKQNFGSKHFHVIAQNDNKFADFGLLEVDNLNMRISANQIQQPILLLPIRKEEEILVVNRIEPLDEKYDAHDGILKIFSNQMEEKTSQNNEAIRVTQKLLRHFVTNPEDNRSVAEILADQNPQFSDKYTPEGERFLKNAKEEERINRGLLSILSNPRVNFGGIETLNPEVLRERSDEGMFLYDSLFENYEKTGDSRSLLQYLKNTEELLDGEAKNSGRMLAIHNHDWRLLGGYGYIASDDVFEIVKAVEPDDFVKILPGFESINYSVKAFHLFLKKSKKIKNTLSKLKVRNFIQERLEKMPISNFEKLLKISTMAEKKELKKMFASRRDVEAAKKIKILRERDAQAPSAILKDLLTFYRQAEIPACVNDFLEYKKAQKNDPQLKPWRFMMEKQKR